MKSDFAKFLIDNWALLVLGVISLIPVIPQKLVDPFASEMNKRMRPPWPEMRYSFLRFVCKGLFAAFAEFAINIGLKGSVTVLMFLAVGFDLLNKKTLSSETVVVIIVAAVSLYLEYLVTNAEEIEFFRIFKYKRKKEPPRSLPIASQGQTPK